VFPAGPWRETDFFKAVNTDGTSRGRRCGRRLRKVSGDALVLRALEIEANPPLHQDAADKASLSQYLSEPSWYLGHRLHKTLNLVPGGRIIVPFFRVPSNLTMSAGQRMPILAQLSPKNWSGHRGGRRAQGLAMARMTSGALTAGVVASLVAAGGSLPTGPRNPGSEQAVARDDREPA